MTVKFNNPADSDGRAFIASVSGDAVTFAATLANGSVDAASRRVYSSKDTPTFTDAVLRFAKEVSLGLEEAQFVIAVAGAIRGDSVRVTNGRWFISLSGIETMLRKRPLVLNDVSAVAWSTLSLSPRDVRSLDAVAAKNEMSSRCAIIWIGEGLGAACLAVDDENRAFVLDGEGGHMTCPLDTDDQKELLGPLRLRHGHLSYERALIHCSRQPWDVCLFISLPAQRHLSYRSMA